MAEAAEKDALGGRRERGPQPALGPVRLRGGRFLLGPGDSALRLEFELEGELPSLPPTVEIAEPRLRRRPD